MTGVVAVALGGALGAVARYLVSVAVSSAPGVGVGFPWATLTINLTGSLGIGLAWGSWSHLPWFQEWGRAFLVVGVLGGFTTFSSVAYETATILRAGQVPAALVHIGLQLLLGIPAVFVGYWAAR